MYQAAMEAGRHAAVPEAGQLAAQARQLTVVDVPAAGRHITPVTYDDDDVERLATKCPSLQAGKPP